MNIVARLVPIDGIWRLVSHIADRKTENYKKLFFFVKFYQNLRKKSSLKMVRFFLRSVYIVNIAIQ